MSSNSDRSNSKTTFHALWIRHYFDISALSASAGVDVAILHGMLQDQPVFRYQAELVLVALTDELGESYTLENVDIVLAPDEQ